MLYSTIQLDYDGTDMSAISEDGQVHNDKELVTSWSAHDWGDYYWVAVF